VREKLTEMFDYGGKKVVVTGCSLRIGAATAHLADDSERPSSE
jgi:hypothetical protein